MIRHSYPNFGLSLSYRYRKLPHVVDLVVDLYMLYEFSDTEIRRHFWTYLQSRALIVPHVLSCLVIELNSYESIPLGEIAAYDLLEGVDSDEI